MNAAQIILQQLGGNRFIAFTGSKNLSYGDQGNTLYMHLTKNKAKAKYLSISLKSDDTYTMTFSTLKKNELVEIEKTEGVYCDMLQDEFTRVTGLYTRF